MTVRFAEAYDYRRGTDPDFMRLTHEVMSGHGLAYEGSISGHSTNYRSFDKSIDDGHRWYGKSDVPVKHKALAKDLTDIGWVPETEGHADMGSYTWQKFRHPETHLTTLRINVGTLRAPEHDGPGFYHTRAEVL